jgi:NHL repeat
MTIKPLLGRVMLGAAALALGAGCSASQGVARAIPLPLNSSTFKWPQGWPATKKPILFVADLQNSAIRLYDPNTPNPSPEGSITDGISNPTGIAVDADGALYVNNVGAYPNTITVYAPGMSKPRLTIKTSGYYGMAVDSKDNIFATSVAGTLYAYHKGDKQPYETIGGFDNPVGVAVDSKDNVWVADDSANKIYEIPKGTKQVEDAHLAQLASPVGIAFGHNDALYVANNIAATIAIYHAGSKKPSVTIKNGVTDPTLNGITASGIFFQSNQTTNVVGYKPGEKTPFSTITGLADPLGIASSPEIKK